MVTNKPHSTIYTGVTSRLAKRIIEHKNKVYPNSFTARYNVNKLVYYEGFHRIEEAIAREKQIKAGPRKKKEMLINSMNPEWKDLLAEVMEL